MAATEAAIQVTLRCSDRLDEYDTRTFTLRPGAAVQIGRASKNSAKPELMIGPGNAFIDSPTISREHAVLTATSPPAPCVYITDKGSMHGTMVNGNKLEPQKAHRLSNGDVLQFGANVTRENLFYTSRSFAFDSSLPSYPKGFSVPEDIESSDEEEVEMDESLSRSPRYGTQTNPVTIEDAEEAQKVQFDLTDDDEFDDDELDKDLQDATVPLEASEDTQERSPSSDVEEHLFYPEDVSSLSARSQHLFGDDVSSEDDIASDCSSEDDMVSHIESCASLADSDESQSDGDMELEDNEDEENEMPSHVPSLQASAFPSNNQMQLMLLEQQNKRRLLMARHEQGNMQNATVRESRTATSESQGPHASSELGMAVPPAPFAPLASSSSVAARKDDAPVPFISGAQSASKAEPPKLPEPEARMDQFFNPFEEIVFGNIDPPRPAAPRPMQWGMLDYNSPFSPPMNAPSFAYSPDILGHYPGSMGSLLPNPYAAQQPPASPDNTWAPPKNSAAALASRVQTPPPAPSSDVSSPPMRRTEVSIREIVEDTVQQPPTPTSVPGGVKRKAEVLDEPVEEADGETSLALRSEAEPETSGVAQDVQAPTAPDAAINQRPKKRLRSRIGGAVKTAAAWMVPGVVGAAASVAFLTSVPNDFFVA